MGQSHKKEPRAPVFQEMMVSLERNLDLSNPFDTCVWAAAVTGLYGLCRLGELLPKSKPSFSPKTHMMRDKIFPEFDLEGLPYIRLRLPKDKVSKGTPVDISVLQARIGNTLSLEAILNHLRINCALSDSDPLFAYWSHKEHIILPLTKRAFLDRCKNVWSQDAEVSGGIDNVSGHSFRIGGASRLWALKVGIEFIMMAGRWKSISWELYIRMKAQVVVNEITHRSFEAPNNRQHSDIHEHEFNQPKRGKPVAKAAPRRGVVVGTASG
ncbi:hypothetical protein BT69DRAFT_314309 [Atractiella rhizophila]|nr:hypothetical protein BT69DRAFT_314309 [Atractiella rhizophila]